jgi:3-dehydroquinate dehydratase/shikimate dehydrogenase
VSIFAESREQVCHDVASAIEAGADAAEIRVDDFGAPLELPDFRIPIIFTCRPTWEGGSSQLSDQERLDLLALFAESSSQTESIYLDVELETWLRRPDVSDLWEAGAYLIVSAHDFRGRPHKLFSLLVSMTERPAKVNKFVWLARSIRDNLEAFELIHNRPRPTIALCMGEAGLISRVLAKKFGAFLTFASLRRNDATAPGQPTIHELKNLYRWDAINERTKVYGVVGSPVAHSLSPAVHNAAFAHVGHDGIYLPMLVEPSYESFKAFMESFLAFPGLDLSGLSITLPHKENALRYLQWKGAAIDETALRVGAVNTITIRDGALSAANTDHDAILDSITTAMGISRDRLADLRVAVIGAGGTGRTAVAALAGCGATVLVYNRTKERADALAAEFDGNTGKVVSARMEKLCDSCCHVFVNTTSLGMHPNVDESPFGDRPPRFTPATLVFDTVYNPSKTKLLTQAEAAGAKTVGGIEMFLRQAAMQFKLWTGNPAPLDVMRRATKMY